MTTSNPRDPDNGSASIRSENAALATATETDDATWFDEFTIELRLLGVPGRDIGDALASAREFLADAGTSAEECFGSPKSYATELGLETLPLRRVNRGGLLSGLGVFGLFGFLLSALPLVHGEAVELDLVTLVVVVAVVIVVVIVPTLLKVLARLRLRPWMVVVAALLGLGTSLTLGRWGNGAALLTVPALPIVVVSALLVLVPAIWSQARHSLHDDAIVDPGGSPEVRPSFSTRLFLGAITWGMVILSIVIWLFALFGS